MPVGALFSVNKNTESENIMKQVTATALLASPEDTGHRLNTEQGEGHIYTDGSVIVPATGAIFAPESTDGDLWRMRQEFDKRHGITVTQRVLLPVIVMHQGALSDRPTGNYA